MSEPLAERMRPKTLDDYVGQKHLVGKDDVAAEGLLVEHAEEVLHRQGKLVEQLQRVGRPVVRHVPVVEGRQHKVELVFVDVEVVHPLAVEDRLAHLKLLLLLTLLWTLLLLLNTLAHFAGNHFAVENVDGLLSNSPTVFTLEK